MHRLLVIINLLLFLVFIILYYNRTIPTLKLKKIIPPTEYLIKPKYFKEI